MKWEDWNEVYEEPAVDVPFGYLFEVTDNQFCIWIFLLGEEVQYDICIEKDLYEEIPSFMDRVGRGGEGHVEERREATVTDKE